MIRLFSVLCKLNQIKYSDWQWFTDAVQSGIAPQEPCPYCSAKGCMRAFGSYKRYLVEWDGLCQKSNTVTIRRYVCDSCHHTHALLPSCIIPYRSYSLRFLLNALLAYFTRTCSVEQVCSRYGITVSTLYRWLHLFLRLKELWLGILESASSSPDEFISAIDGVFVRDFFSQVRFSFLESFRDTDLNVPPQ